MPYPASRIAFITLCLFNISSIAQEEGMRGLKNCEIIFAKAKLSLSVYSTIGLNDCPDSLWKNITPAKIKRETGSFFAYLNGSRYWVVDGYENHALVESYPKLMAGLPMREAGIVPLTLLDIINGAAPYRQHQVMLETTWLYKAGRSVYELIDPQGQTFVMLSYSVERRPLKESHLVGLGSQLSLPKGWQFKTLILNENLYLPAVNNSAVFIQDNLLNTYQRIS